MRKKPEKTSPRKPVPTGDRTRARCVTDAHAAAWPTAVDPCIPHFIERYNIHVAAWKVKGLLFGARGTSFKFTSTLLRTLKFTNNDIRKMSVQVIVIKTGHSRLITTLDKRSFNIMYGPPLWARRQHARLSRSGTGVDPRSGQVSWVRFFRGFSSPIGQMSGSYRSPRTPNIIWPPLSSSSLIIHYGHQ